MQIGNNLELNKNTIERDHFRDISAALAFNQGINTEQTTASLTAQTLDINQFISEAESLSPVRVVAKQEKLDNKISLLRSAAEVNANEETTEDKKKLNYDLLSKINSTIALLIFKSKKSVQEAIKKITESDLSIGHDKKGYKG